MNQAARPGVGTPFPAMTWPAVGGGVIDIAGTSGWRILVIYRGRHCPLCKTYLTTLDKMLEEFTAAGIGVVAISSDPAEKAAADVAQFGWRFPVGHDLTPDQIRTLGLYLSAPRTPQETDRPFAEPGLFVVNAENIVQAVDISNAPYARPDLAALLRGIVLVRDRGLPVRGTMA
jgi:peroxiredoxin